MTKCVGDKVIINKFVCRLSKNLLQVAFDGVLSNLFVHIILCIQNGDFNKLIEKIRTKHS